ncbi:MAG TPA: hypothetical protein VHQ87_11545, partial [Rhizobacter sp.]|nr:hypothetical protein [Rhizobacter sp.]
PANGSRADSLKPAQASLLVYPQEAPRPKPRPMAPAPAKPAPQRPSVATRVGSLLQSLGVGRLLQR